MAVSFVLNGETVRLGDGEIDPHTTLLQWLRGRGLTGSKEGCAEGECGACAVAILRRDAGGAGARLDPVNSCLVPLLAVAGQSIVTVEGVAGPTGALHPVQRMMADAGGSQCGYCTPGFVVSLFCEYYRPGRTGYDPEAIGGNLCRCTGYRPIVDVARALPRPAAGDPRLAWLGGAPPPALAALDEAGAGVRFQRPASLADALGALGAEPDAVVMAGGTDLMVQVNQRHQRFAALVSLEAVPELRRFEVDDQQIVIGAGVTLSDIEARVAPSAGGVAAELSMLHQVLRLFSSRLIRNRATLGGNLGTASPIGDGAPALLALDATLTLASAAGTRRVALAEFFLGYRKTALAPGELIVSVHLPRPLPAQQRFYKVSKRELDDISTVAGAFGLDLTPDGRVQRLRIAYGGVAATPLRARAAEALAVGKPWSSETLTALVAALEGLGSPMTDHRGSAAYRRAMMGRLLEKLHADTATPAGAAA
jgi:xanthine dehydrogenase small subunit